MENWQRDILRRHQSYLEEDLEPTDILSNFSPKVLTNADVEQIRAQSTRKERCDKLLEILPRKGPTAFKEFVEALKKKAPHLALVLIVAGNKEEPNQSSALRDRSINEVA